ncbi:trehalose-phosphatase [Kocuria flava]|uniref:trehalose-phosphatase n=1 Tax=Kocuria flava TaxID=446860 RepID=UPI001FF34834|nr:trehalose-phosphatase [Kocuria flava]MCJ8505215.1 trehalose-phosphatase [Kocuria flava]
MSRTDDDGALRAGAGEPESLDRALERAAAAGTLLVALDFDGTLAPFTADPGESRALPEAQSAMEALLQEQDTYVAVISGRPMAFLRSVVDPAGRMLLSGSHGAEMHLDALGDAAGDMELRLSPEQQELLAAATALVEQQVARHPGSLLELKPTGAAFHTRTMDDQSRCAQAEQEMVEAFEQLDGLRITPGQHVVESSVHSATKGEGITAFMQATGADVTLFAGDDVTDENAMRELGPHDVGIKVGSGQSVAAHRVADPQELAAALTRLAGLRGGR